MTRPDAIYSQFHLDNWTDADFAKHPDATRKTLAWLLEVERQNAALLANAAPGLDEDGMCNDHGAFMCKRCCPEVRGEN